MLLTAMCYFRFMTKKYNSSLGPPVNLRTFAYIIGIGLLGYLFSGSLVFKNYPVVIKFLEAQPNLDASNEYSKYHYNEKVRALYVKKANLLDSMRQFTPDTHAAKTVFRLTIPVIMKLFNLSILQLYYLQLVLGLLICILLSYISFDITRNYFSTALFTVGIACTYFVKASFWDSVIWGDTFAYFLLLSAICFRKNPAVLIFSVFALFFCDERGILAISIIWACIKFLDRDPDESISFKSLISFKDNSKYLVLTIIIGIALRLFLSYSYGLSLPNSGSKLGYFSAVKYSGDLQLAFFTALGGFWGIIVLTLAQTVIDKKYVIGIVVAVITCGLAVASAIVFDVTRSITFLVPICFIPIWYFKGQTSFLSKILLIVCSINLLYPKTLVILGIPAGIYDSYLFTKLFKAIDFLSRHLF